MYVVKDPCLLSQVTRVPSMILLSWFMSHTSLNVFRNIIFSNISEILFTCVSLIMSNCFLASAQSKHWVKNSILYNLMAAKMIDELETAYMSFCASYTVLMELNTKKKSRRKIWTWEWLLSFKWAQIKWNLNEVQLLK